MKNFKFQISNLKFSVYYLLFSVYCSLFFTACAKKDTMYRESHIVMDTFCTITVVSPSRGKAHEAINAGFTEIKKLEHLLNLFSPESEITALNKASDREPVRVSKETLEIIKKAISELFLDKDLNTFEDQQETIISGLGFLTNYPDVVTACMEFSKG